MECSAIAVARTFPRSSQMSVLVPLVPMSMPRRYAIIATKHSEIDALGESRRNPVDSAGMRLDELAGLIDAQLVGGDGATQINAIAPIDTATAGQVAFLSNPKYAKALERTKASAVIVSHKVAANHVPLLKTADPYFAFRQAVVAVHGYREHPHDGIHPAAHVEPSAKIGARTVIYPGAYVGANCIVGDDCVIFPNAVIYDDTRIGNRVTIHACAVIGVDGFGFATHAGVHHKIPQVGRVVLEDDVEIGPCCSIERGALEETRIGAGTKMDGLVVIGHATTIGPHGILVAQTGIAGSVTIGHHVTMGGQTGVAGHLKIGNNVSIGAQSGVMSDVEDNAVMIGAPAMPASRARRVYMMMTKLPELVDRLRDLEQRLASLEDEDDPPIA
jgi:UDP-3-O-[3-hydroxymyristoyl] glucosamine N-acyltransferase